MLKRKEVWTTIRLIIIVWIVVIIISLIVTFLIPPEIAKWVFWAFIVLAAVTTVIAGAAQVASYVFALDTGASSDKKPNLRNLEIKYLEELVSKFSIWEKKYVALNVITESAIINMPADLEVANINKHYEEIFRDSPIKEMYGPVSRDYPEHNVTEVIGTSRRVVLLGVPGSGKSTTLWYIALRYALTALTDNSAQIPLLINLADYSSDEDFMSYVKSRMTLLSPYLDDLMQERRLIFLFDALNELPTYRHQWRRNQIKSFLSTYADQSVIITCQEYDFEMFEVDFKLEKVRIRPLNALQILQFCENYLPKAGEELFWQMAGDPAREFWKQWQFEKMGDFQSMWESDAVPKRMNDQEDEIMRELRLVMRDKGTSHSILSLARNPYMLFMISFVYRLNKGLPQNRGQLFEAFVNDLFVHENIKSSMYINKLSNFAFELLRNNSKQSFSLEEEILQSENFPELMKTNLLTSDGTSIRFSHELLQDYFAAKRLNQEVLSNVSAKSLFPMEDWWEGSGWEETIILLAGFYINDCSKIIEWINKINPLLAARCIHESGSHVTAQYKSSLVNSWMESLRGDMPPRVRAYIGQAISIVGDPRMGVLISTSTDIYSAKSLEYPNIIWCNVEEGKFFIGSDSKDVESNSSEFPQSKIELGSFHISKYPITNAQYNLFLFDTNGYSNPTWWTQEGLGWKNEKKRLNPSEYGYPYNLANHPRVGVSWYEAMAYCNWLMHRLRRVGYISESQEVMLPSEDQWEKAARGVNANKFPWGNTGNMQDRCNCEEAQIGSTSIVGMFPQGDSPYGVSDCSGNVWEWCLSQWRSNYKTEINNSIEGNVERVIRGGSFMLNRYWSRCAARLAYTPASDFAFVGFRIILREK